MMTIMCTVFTNVEILQEKSQRNICYHRVKSVLIICACIGFISCFTIPLDMLGLMIQFTPCCEASEQYIVCLDTKLCIFQYCTFKFI